MIQAITTRTEEAMRREASFLSSISTAEDDYEWIRENKAWIDLGFDSLANWWESRVVPVMRALSMQPTRQIGRAVVEQTRSAKDIVRPVPEPKKKGKKLSEREPTAWYRREKGVKA